MKGFECQRLLYLLLKVFGSHQTLLQKYFSPFLNLYYICQSRKNGFLFEVKDSYKYLETKIFSKASSSLLMFLATIPVKGELALVSFEATYNLTKNNVSVPERQSSPCANGTMEDSLMPVSLVAAKWRQAGKDQLIHFGFSLKQLLHSYQALSLSNKK